MNQEKLVRFLLLFVPVPLLLACGHRQKINGNDIPAMDGYKLVWHDEFNINGRPDTSNWRYEHGFVRNEEDQWYQEDNVYCRDGLLVIEGRREARKNPRHLPNGNDWRASRDSIHYSSSSINTREKNSWQYGRFIMRGRIDMSDGLWPAWWTLGITKPWPANGEIDIMEYYRKMLLANIACLGSNGKPEWFSNRFASDSLGGKQWASQFHVWQMNWDENEIALYVDNSLLNKVSLNKLVNKDGSGFQPFKQPHYMLLNLAIGGQNGGDPSHTTFPNRFEVDYVRVFQKL